MKFITSILFFNLLFSQFVSAAELNVEVEGKLVNSYCSENFGLISFRFDNRSADWIKLGSFELDFGGDKLNEHVKIVSGKALGSWYEGISIERDSKQFYQNLLFGSSAFIGGSMAALGNGRASSSGAAIATASLGVLAASSLGRQLETINSSDIFPRNHLFYEDVLVAPGLSADRWVLVYTKNNGEVPFLDKMTLKYLIHNTNESGTKKIMLRPYEYTACSWQKSIAPVDTY